MKFSVGDNIVILDKVRGRVGQKGVVIGSYEQEPNNPNCYIVNVRGQHLFLHEDEITHITQGH